MTDKPQLYVVDDTGSTIQNDEVETFVLDADAQAERMSFGAYSMTKDGLLLGEDYIAGPFEILGRARDPSGDDWARWVRFKDADGRYHQVAIRDADLHGDYFNNLEVEERVTFVPRTGWHNVGNRRVFVLPGEAFGANELVLLNSDATSPYGYSGTLTDWQNGIGRLTAGQRLGVLAVSTALAGPLLHLSGQDGGGIHIRGSSSTGKTSLARAAASVWGPRAYTRSWRATANGLEGAAVLATDTLLVLDELGVIESRELNAAVYQLAIGSGKGRARRDGSMRTPASWRVMVVSTGEVSIAGKVEEDRNRRAKAGQEVRILDIPADVGLGFGAFDAPRDGEDSAAGLADEIVRSAEEFYGTAGPAFLQAIIDHGTDEIITRVNTGIETFCAGSVRFGTDGQIRRAARRLALIAAGGELAIGFGIVPWKEGEAIKAAEFALEKWIAGRGGSEAAEVIQAIRSVRLFIEKYGDSRFEEIRLLEGNEYFESKIIPNRAGWRKGKGEEQVWMVLPEVWKSEVCAGLDPTMVAQTLHERGMLERPEKERGYQMQQWIAGLGRTHRAYTVTARIFSGTNNESVGSVGSVGSPCKTGTSDDTQESEKASNINVLPTLPTLPTESDKEDVSKAGGTEPDPDDWSFNKEDEDLDIPGFLDRRGQS